MTYAFCRETQIPFTGIPCKFNLFYTHYYTTFYKHYEKRATERNIE